MNCTLCAEYLQFLQFIDGGGDFRAAEAGSETALQIFQAHASLAAQFRDQRAGKGVCLEEGAARDVEQQTACVHFHFV